MTTPAKVTSVFVYGTLKRHGARHHLWPYPPVRIVSARIRGTLYDMGPYPALGPARHRLGGRGTLGAGHRTI